MSTKIPNKISVKNKTVCILLDFFFLKSQALDGSGQMNKTRTKLKTNICPTNCHKMCLLWCGKDFVCSFLLSIDLNCLYSYYLVVECVSICLHRCNLSKEQSVFVIDKQYAIGKTGMIHFLILFKFSHSV